ncbi:hypothetical protein D3C80_1920700 [compost metagenome]
MVIHNVTGILPRQGAVHPCNSLQQGVFLKRLVEVHGADNGSIPPRQQHVGNDDQPNVVCVQFTIQPLAFITVGQGEQFVDEIGDLL